MIAAVADRDPILPAHEASEAIGLSCATYSRASAAEAKQMHAPLVEANARRKPSRALSDEEIMTVLHVLKEPSAADKSVAQVYGEMLKNGTYLCLMRTMYRYLKRNDEVRERRCFARCETGTPEKPKPPNVIG
jgi:putative transposase